MSVGLIGSINPRPRSDWIRIGLSAPYTLTIASFPKINNSIYTFEFDEWETLNIGDSITIKVGIDGSAKLYTK